MSGNEHESDYQHTHNQDAPCPEGAVAQGMIDCRETSRRLWAYLDGELTALSQEEVQAHLTHCTGCLHLTETQRRFLGLLHIDQSTEAGREAQAAALKAKVLDRLAEARAQGLP
jgi:anti-sigma factor RsiW